MKTFSTKEKLLLIIIFSTVICFIVNEGIHAEADEYLSSSQIDLWNAEISVYSSLLQSFGALNSKQLGLTYGQIAIAGLIEWVKTNDTALYNSTYEAIDESIANINQSNEFLKNMIEHKEKAGNLINQSSDK